MSEVLFFPHVLGLTPGVAALVHGMDTDPFFAQEGDLDAARALAAAQPEVEVFTYPGSTHLFTDAGVDGHDPAAVGLLLERVLTLLARLG